jgi:hypothetical protein
MEHCLQVAAPMVAGKKKLVAWNIGVAAHRCQFRQY